MTVAVVRLLSLVIAFALTGCASKIVRNPVRKPLVNVVKIPGIPDARYWDDEALPDADARIKKVRA